MIKLEDKLKFIQKYQKRTLQAYSDTLTRVVQIIYEVDATVEWVKIEKFSPDSNFVQVIGNAVVPKGSSLKDRVLDEDMEFLISVTIQYSMLEDNSTAYQIAEAVHRLNMVKQIVGSNFSTVIKDPKFTIETMEDYIGDNTEYLEGFEHKKEEPKQKKEIAVADPRLEGFDLSELSESQKESLRLYQLSSEHVKS